MWKNILKFNIKKKYYQNLVGPSIYRYLCTYIYHIKMYLPPPLQRFPSSGAGCMNQVILPQEFQPLHYFSTQQFSKTVPCVSICKRTRIISISFHSVCSHSSSGNTRWGNLLNSYQRQVEKWSPPVNRFETIPTSILRMQPLSFILPICLSIDDHHSFAVLSIRNH